MKKFLKILGWSLLVLLLVGAYAGYRIVWGHPFTLNQLANRQAMFFLVRNPGARSRMIGAVDGTPLDRHSGKLARGRPREARRRTTRSASRRSPRSSDFDRAKLEPQEQITYDILLDFYGTQAKFARVRLAVLRGPVPDQPDVRHAGAARELHADHPRGEEREDWRATTSRASQAMGAKLDGLTAEMQRQSAAGVVLPPSLLEKSLVVIERHDRAGAGGRAPSSRPSSSAWRRPRASTRRSAHGAARRGDRGGEDQRVPGLRAHARGPDRGAAEGGGHGGRRRAAARGRGLLPGHARAVHHHRLHAASRCTRSASPRWRASTPRWTRCCDSQGLETGTVAERMTALRQDPRFLLPNTDEGREQVLARYREILDDMAARMPEYFRTIPPEQLAVERVPASAEKGSAGAYYNPAAMDGSRPGTFYANLRNTSEMPTWGMKTLAYHEGIPGHHFQIATGHGLEGPAADPPAADLHRLQRGLGAVRRASRGRDRPLCRRSVRRPRPPAGRDVPRGAPRRGHGPARQGLDRASRRSSTWWAPAARRERGHLRGRALHGAARARRRPTRSASSRSWSCARRPAPRSAKRSTSRTSTPSCSRTAPCRSPCSSGWWTSGSRALQLPPDPAHRRVAAREDVVAHLVAAQQ